MRSHNEAQEIRLCCVKYKGDALQDPVAVVMVALEIRLEYQPHAHLVAALLRHVDGRQEGALGFLLGDLDGDDFEDRQFRRQHLRREEGTDT